MESRRKLTPFEIMLVVILVLLLIALCIFGVFLIRNLSSSGEDIAIKPSETPVTEIDPGLCLVDGKLIVGTSADYPPFATYSSDFKMVGYDISLMEEIARRIGVPIEFRDMAFEGLGNALMLNEISAAAAAISVTPEREVQFGFSNIYLVSSEGFLARVDSTQEMIVSIDQLISQRIGVQRGSVYEQWLQVNLVATGLAPGTNIYAYESIDLAVNDLITSKIDLVILDYGPAKKFSEQGSARLVGYGLSQQSYAIGLRQDCPVLQERINTALFEMQSDGTMDALAKQFLNLNVDEVIPPPTPLPPTPQPTALPPVVATPTLAPGCIDGMAFVQDLTFPDFNMTAPPLVAPGTSFQKGWRLRNTGTCTWTDQYFLAYAGGNSPYSQMGGSTTYISGLVSPGDTYDLYVNLVSPVFPGIYQGFWELNNSQSSPFGNRIWVGIQVPAQNPSTPTPVPGFPQIYRFIINPPEIQAGQCVQINWEVTGQVSGVSIFRDGTPLWVSGPAIGTLQDCPNYSGVITYSIEATGPGGTARADRQITVFDNPPPTATPPPLPPPVITNFDVTPSQIELGGCVMVNWAVNGTVDYVRLFRNQQVILDNAANAGSLSDCPSQPGSTLYRLEASGADQTVSNDRAITVTEPDQAPPFANQNWFLVYIGSAGTDLQPVIPGTQVSAYFDQQGGIEGVGGCNSYGGRYTASGNAITVDVDFTSRVECPEPAGVMEQENNFIARLESVTSYTLNGNELTFYQGDSPVLVFSLLQMPR